MELELSREEIIKILNANFKAQGFVFDRWKDYVEPHGVVMTKEVK